MPDMNQQDTEYNAAYEAELQRLEQEAAKATTLTEPGATVADEPVIEQPAAAANAADASGEDDKFAALTKRLESTEKALNDTKAYATRNAQELARIRKEREEQERKANRPAILDDNPGLEEAVRHVTGARADDKRPVSQQSWAETVGTALPDLNDMLAKDPALQAKAEAKARELGDDWNNPIIAIRELGKLQLESVRDSVAGAAREQAARDFAQRGKKQAAMSVPGGSGNRAPAAAPVKDFSKMSSAEFQKETQRVLGYG